MNQSREEVLEPTGISLLEKRLRVVSPFFVRSSIHRSPINQPSKKDDVSISCATPRMPYSKVWL